LKHFVEELLTAPRLYHYPIIILFLPLSFVYGVVMWVRRVVSRRESFGLPIISVGNLTLGGSGKTPFVIEIALRYEGVWVISRGYGRKSRGLVEVSRRGRILTTVEESGDEAMLMAKRLYKASVIVSEERKEAIRLAKEQGAKLIILDDGFNRVDINKFEILLTPPHIKNYFPLPAGGFREFPWMGKKADVVLKEERDFKRVVTYSNLKERMVLATSIANPSRLNRYLPKGIVAKYILGDHEYFDQAKLYKILKDSAAQSLLVTQKDAVKLLEFNLPLSLIHLSLAIDEEVFEKIDGYIARGVY